MNELTYWYALANMQGITKRRKNDIYVNAYKSNISIVEMFDNSSTWDKLGMSDEEMSAFTIAGNDLVNCSFVVEDLLSQGYNIIPMTDTTYSKNLKKNLNRNVPMILYTKGNVELLNELSVAIVGSRNASEKSLQFTANMARKCATEGKVVVSGFAKGVDRMALDAALQAGGKSIIVLPQGITTFSSGMRQYYQAIIQGRLLVISTFAPKAPWTAGFAMERNHYIYGLAKDIYVAQSDDKGGTWEGVIDGLRKKMPIFVRKPDDNEKNANMLLIQKGATPIDFNGCIIEMNPEDKLTPKEKEERELNEKIRQLLKGKEMSSKDIAEKITLPTKDAKTYLRKLSFIDEHKKSNKVFFFIKGEGPASEPNLFN